MPTPAPTPNPDFLFEAAPLPDGVDPSVSVFEEPLPVFVIADVPKSVCVASCNSELTMTVFPPNTLADTSTVLPFVTLADKMVVLPSTTLIVYVSELNVSVVAPLVIAGRTGSETCEVTTTGVASIRVVCTTFVTRTLTSDTSVTTGGAATGTPTGTSVTAVWVVVVVVVGCD
jgi:hypothetical protein